MLSITEHTRDYRGDHSADVQIAHEVLPNETVEDLAARVLPAAEPIAQQEK